MLFLQLLLLFLQELFLLLLLYVVPAHVPVHGDLLCGAVGTHGAGEGLLPRVGPDVAPEVVTTPERLPAEGAGPGAALALLHHGPGGRRRQQRVRLLEKLQLQQRRSEGHRRVRAGRGGAQRAPTTSM